MTKGELYAVAYKLDHEWRKNYARVAFKEESVIMALECIWANGCSDAHSGTVDAPTGFFYRLDIWMVVVDQQGFKHLHTYETEDLCRRAFNELDDEYSDWDNDFIEL